jgi:hypothetical protein
VLGALLVVLDNRTWYPIMLHRFSSYWIGARTSVAHDILGGLLVPVPSLFDQAKHINACSLFVLFNSR